MFDAKLMCFHGITVDTDELLAKDNNSGENLEGSTSMEMASIKGIKHDFGDFSFFIE